MSTSNAMMKENWTPPNIALAACTLLMLLTSASTLFASHGNNQSTALMVLSTLSLVGIAVLHSVRHLGVRYALMYFAIIVVIELIFEQVNIWSAGKVFGELSYPDNYFGPKILDIPIAVPLAMCAINWPTYVLVNIILFRRVVVTSKNMGVIAAVFHCAILATLHTAWSYCAEPMALANGILHRPTIGDNSGLTHWGVPWVEFRGWWLMTFLQFMVFSFVLARVFKLPAEKPFSPVLESAPLVMYGGIALLLLINPVNQDLAIGTVFTMLAYVSLGFFRAWQKSA